jgi:hypothetical protein
MDYDLSDEYLADARQRAYRYQGQWTGTAGSLAADVARLLLERKRMQEAIATLEESNAMLRAAVEERLAGSCCEGVRCHTTTTTTDEVASRWKDITKASAEKYAAEREETVPVDWILQGQREMEAAPDDIRWTGDSLLATPPDGLRPEPDAGNPAERLLLEALAVIRDRRPKYGGPRHHFRRTVGMINAAFADVLKRPLTESDWAIFMTFDKVARFLGPNKTADGPIDLAGYAACLAECESAEPV